MDSRFFVSKPIQKDSFFTIRKVGIRETEDSDNDLSRIRALVTVVQPVRSLDILFQESPRHNF